MGEEKLGEKRGKEREKNTRREGILCQMPHPRLALSGGRLFCTLRIITIKILSLPVLNISGHSWPSLGNIAKLIQNAESYLEDDLGELESNAEC